MSLYTPNLTQICPLRIVKGKNIGEALGFDA
jgi:hypothetical protein